MSDNLKQGKTDFIDTLIAAYSSLDQESKEKLNKLAMKLYLESDFGKNLINNKVGEGVEQASVAQDLSEEEPPKNMMTRLASSLRSLSKIGG